MMKSNQFKVFISRRSDSYSTDYECIVGMLHTNGYQLIFEQKEPMDTVLFAGDLNRRDIEPFIKDSYNKGFKIMLIKPEPEDIKTMGRLLNFCLSHNEEDSQSKDGLLTDFLCLQKDTDGSFIHLSRKQSPNIKENRPQDVDDLSASLLPVLDVMSDVNRPSEADLSRIGQTAPLSNEINLLEYASKYYHSEYINAEYNGKKDKNLYSKSFLCNFFITSCHVFDKDGGKDWYFVEQLNVLTADQGYSKYYESQYYYCPYDNQKYYAHGDVCRHYVPYYEMECKLPDNTEARLISSSPDTQQNQIEITTSSGWSIGGGLNLTFKPGADDSVNFGGQLSAGGQFSKSEKFIAKDCEVINNSKAGTGAVAWKYKIRGAGQNSRGSANLRAPADVAYNTFQPKHMWLWNIPTKNRSNNMEISFKLLSEIEICITRVHGSQAPTYKRLQNTANRSIKLEPVYPPLFGLSDNKISFGKEGGTKEISLESAYPWELHIDKSTLGWVTVSRSVGNANEKETLVVGVQTLTGENRRSGDLYFVNEENGQQIGKLRVDQVKA